MPADTQLLAAVPLFERFNDEEREFLVSQLDEVEFQAGQMIFRRTDPGGAIFIVASGEVEVFIEDSTGSRIVFETVKPGHFFGELSLLDKQPRSATVSAVSPMTVLVMGPREFTSALQTIPGLATKLLAGLARRLRETNQRVIQH